MPQRRKKRRCPVCGVEVARDKRGRLLKTCGKEKCRAALRLAGGMRGVATRQRNAQKRLESTGTRFCTRCKTKKPLTQKNFSVERRWPDGTIRSMARWCRVCKAAAVRESRARNPEKRREQQRRSYQKMMSDPKKLEERRARERFRKAEARRKKPEAEAERQRRYREKRRADPERHRAHLEKLRIDNTLRTIRRGSKVRPGARKHDAVSEEGLPVLPIEPFQEWLGEKLKDSSIEEFAPEVNVDPRVLRRVLNQGQRVVSLDLVDRVFCAYGDPRLLYEVYGGEH